MPKLNDILLASIARLTTQQIPTPRLDAELLLAHALKVNRSWLHAHNNDELTQKQLQEFGKFIERRLNREPIAYITGTKEFYGREFIVTHDVLIPRPETEDLVELGIETAQNIPFISDRPWGLYVIDVGTGSGAVGLTLMAESQRINDIILADISPKALAIAKQNNRKLFHLKRVQYYESDLLTLWSSNQGQAPFADLIIANLPYVNKNWETSPETSYEPAIALYADQNGLALIFQLIKQSKVALRQFGYLLLEADPEQHQAIINFASEHDFAHKATRGYAISFMKLPQA